MNVLNNGYFAGIVGALLGGVIVYSLDNDNDEPKQAVNKEQEVTTALLQRLDRTDALLNEIKTDLASEQVARREMRYSEDSEEAGREEATEVLMEPTSYGEAATDVYDIAVEEAIVQNIVTRLNDPVYTQSTTLAEVMQSEDMRKLSDQARERVVVEMLGKLNRGEIDASTFMPSPENQE